MGLFMLFFPVAGILYVWNDAHDKIQWRAMEFYELSAPSVFQDWEFETWKEDSTASLMEEIQAGAFDKINSQYGKVVSRGKAVAIRSWTREINDRTHQFALIEFPAKTEKGKVKVEIVVTCMTIGPRWRYEKVTVKPLNSGS